MSPLPRFRAFVQALWERSIWHPGSIPPEEFKYRHLKRVWLPLFDLTAVVIGYLAILYATRILNEMYTPEVLDTVGMVFLAASGLALVGVMFPRLWLPEVIGKVIVLAVLGTYATILWITFAQGSAESGMVAAIVMLPLYLPLFRLQLLGEEIKQRREEEG